MAEDATAAAASVVTDLLGTDADVATETVEQAAPEPQPEVEIPSWEADTDGIEDILTEPDDDEPEFQLEDDQDDEPVLSQQDEYLDPEVAKLRARLAKAEKQNRYLAELRARDNLKGWRAEAARRFPLADVDDIQATSRRAVLRQAQAQHERYTRKVEPLLKTLEELKQSVVAEAKQAAKEEAAQAWGQPTTAPQPQMVQAAEDTTKLDRRNYKNPYELIKARIQGGLEI